MADSGPAACIIGWPVEHSRSPAIHRHWLAEYGIRGDYRREAVRPEDLAGFLAGLSARGYVGANVTIPHKEAALALSSPDACAAAVGAANTLWFDAGSLCSTNTDVEGFMDNLDHEVPGWDRTLARAVVIGAGGAARAVLFGLRARGVGEILLVNRTPGRAEALAAAYGEGIVTLAWERRAEALAGAGLLVNTTSLGMTGQPPLDLDLSPLPREAIVADLVYAPLRTRLLTDAATRGLASVDGLGMLLHQAGRGFELWFGVRPAVTPALRRVVEDAILAH